MAEDLRLSEAQLTDLRRQVEQHRDEAMQARGDWPTRHSEHYRRFLADPSLRPPGPWPDAPRLFIAVTRYVHERLMSDIWQTLFGVPASLRLIPFGEEDVQPAQMATRLLHWLLRKQLNGTTAAGAWERTSATGLFDTLLDSAAVYKVVGWTPPWEIPTTARTRFTRTVRIDPLDQGMLLVPPDATGLQYPDASYIAQDMHLSRDDLFRLRKEGYDIPDPDEVKGDDPIPTERQQIEMEREGQTARPFHPDTYLFTESYERFRLDTRSKFEEDVIVSWFPDAQAGDGTKNASGKIARVRRLIDVFPQDDRPRRPFFEITIWPQPRQWRGLNVPDRIESMQDMINRLHEQLLNYGDVSILPYVFANTFLTGELPDLRQVRPGSTVAVEDVGGVQFAPTRSLNRHFAEQIQLAFSNVERDTAVTDFQSGRQSDRPNAPRTASATLALLQESRKSFSMLARHVAVQYQHMLTFYFRLWQEILPARITAPLRLAGEIENQETQDAITRLFGGDATNRAVAVTLSKEQLSGIFDAELDIDPEAQFDRQILVSLAQLILPAIAQYPVGQRELLKRTWEAFDQKGFEHIWPYQVAATDTQILHATKQVQLYNLQLQLQQLQTVQNQQAAAQEQQQAAQAAQEQQPTAGAPISAAILSALQRAAAGPQNGAPGAVPGRQEPPV